MSKKKEKEKDFKGFEYFILNTTAQHLTKPELRLCADANLTRGMLETCDDEDLWQRSHVEIKLNVFCCTTIPQKQFAIIIYTKKKEWELSLKNFKKETISLQKNSKKVSLQID